MYAWQFLVLIHFLTDFAFLPVVSLVFVFLMALVTVLVGLFVLQPAQPASDGWAGLGWAGSLAGGLADWLAGWAVWLGDQADWLVGWDVDGLGGLAGVSVGPGAGQQEKTKNQQ